MLTVSAARRRLPSPIGLPLAGFLRRANANLRCETEDDPLELNGVAFRSGGRTVVVIAIDALSAGNDVTAAAEALSRNAFGPCTLAIVAASHTHFAPGIDPTKDALGACSPAYLHGVHHALEQLIEDLRSMQTDASLAFATRLASGNVNRRRLWPLPTLLWWMHRRIDLVTMAPNPNGPCDRQVRVAVLRRSGGSPLAVVWNYACHPVFYPRQTVATAEFIGRVRAAVRTHFADQELPVVYLQGFSGDVAPDIRPERSLTTVAETLALGPRWGRFTTETWADWAGEIAKAAVGAVDDARAGAVGEHLASLSKRVPIEELVDGKLPQRSLQVERLEIGDEWRLIALSAEPSAAYADLLCRDGAWPVSCIGDMFGYIPTEAQRRAGGYEVAGYFAAIGLDARLRPGIERRIVDICRTMVSEKA
jgi:hypothetical protein